MKRLIVAMLASISLVGCASVKTVPFYMDGGSKADGYVIVKSEIYNYFTTTPGIEGATEAAKQACSKWGYHGEPQLVRDKESRVDVPLQGSQTIEAFQCSE